MEHHFDIEVAKEYGIVEAVFINNFQFWIAKNKANNINFYDGRYWTFNSKTALQKLFPYLSYDQIRRALERLVSKGVLIKGNYNKDPSDRSLWYSFSDEYYTIWQKRQMHRAEMPNASGENAQPLPYNNTDNKQADNNDLYSSEINTPQNNKSVPKKEKKGFDLSFVNIAFEDVFNEWLEYKHDRHEMYKTQKSLELCYSKLLKFSNNDPHTAQEIIESAIGNNYSGFFELKTNNNNGQRKQQQPESLAKQLARKYREEGLL